MDMLILLRWKLVFDNNLKASDDTTENKLKYSL